MTLPDRVLMIEYTGFCEISNYKFRETEMLDIL